MNFRKSILLSSLVLVLITSSLTNSKTLQRTLPNPILALRNVEMIEENKKSFVRFHYSVQNYDQYPDELFAAAPDLPPCGANTKASRTWLDFFDSRGTRLYGFCALKKSAELNEIWFSIESGQVPPSYVYIELTDRQTGTKYKSNLADTTP